MEHRADDTEEALTKRLNEFYNQTKPIISHYSSQGIVKNIVADKSFGEVWADMLKQLNRLPTVADKNPKMVKLGAGEKKYWCSCGKSKQ